jgi:hypothetical protein
MSSSRHVSLLLLITCSLACFDLSLSHLCTRITYALASQLTCALTLAYLISCAIYLAPCIYLLCSYIQLCTRITYALASQLACSFVLAYLRTPSHLNSSYVLLASCIYTILQLYIIQLQSLMHSYYLCARSTARVCSRTNLFTHYYNIPNLLRHLSRTMHLYDLSTMHFAATSFMHSHSYALASQLACSLALTHLRTRAYLISCAV